MRSCEMEDRSKNDTCMLSGVGVILYGGMTCTVSEAQLGCQATAFMPREEALYITQYIILRHSERSSLISTPVERRSTSVVATHSPECPMYFTVFFGCLYGYTYTDLVTGIRWHHSYHSVITTYHGHTIQHRYLWRARSLSQIRSCRGQRTKNLLSQTYSEHHHQNHKEVTTCILRNDPPTQRRHHQPAQPALTPSPHQYHTS
jgi:hypothetical protein